MSHLDRKGPESLGSKTGRKLGLCNKVDSEPIKIDKLGKGIGKRRHSGGGKGKGKRTKYNINV